jgi:hypothetical protein
MAETAASVMQISQDHPKAPSSLRIIFFILLIAVLLSATATTYILMTWKSNTPTLSPVNSDENPFSSEISSNIFLEPSEDISSTPFNENFENNPFDAFEIGTEATPTQEYENPF